jgi:uncharacterized membrane protein YdjX (TVP38/TMEM64 family)
MPVRRIVLLAAVLAAAAAAAAFLLPHSPAGLRELVRAGGLAAPAIAIGAWILLTPALFPGTILAAACGLAFGAAAGAGVALTGAVLGGLVAFGIARTAGRGHVERLAGRSERFGRLHALLERRGFLAVLAARLMPGVPASGLHYAAGASPVRTRWFTAAIAIGAVLRTAPYALLGQSLGSGSGTAILIAGGSIALGALTAGVLVRQLRTPALAG